jgi:hypothetical protein
MERDHDIGQGSPAAETQRRPLIIWRNVPRLFWFLALRGMIHLAGYIGGAMGVPRGY